VLRCICFVLFYHMLPLTVPLYRPLSDYSASAEDFQFSTRTTCLCATRTWTTPHTTTWCGRNNFSFLALCLAFPPRLLVFSLNVFSGNDPVARL
jgi:hypothetical protein